MKLIIGICGFAVLALAGVYIKSRFQKRENLLAAFTNFCESAKTQISFLQTNLEKLIENEIEHSKGEFKEILKAFLKNLREGMPLEKPAGVDAREWEIMQGMFAGLGKSDVKNQVALCENSKCAIASGLVAAQQKNKNEGTMWFKLMICLAFVPLILLL